MRLMVMRWDIQIENCKTDVNLDIYLMYESYESIIESVYIMWCFKLDDRYCKLIVMC